MRLIIVHRCSEVCFRNINILLLHTLLYNGSCQTEKISKNLCPEQSDYGKDHQQKTKRNDDHLPIHAPNKTPCFSLDDLTLEAGTPYNARLKGLHLTEGYTIQSVAVTKHTTTSYTKQFGVEILINQPIPVTGLPFTLTTSKQLKAGSYRLTLKVGKCGQGSKATLQVVHCVITVLNHQLACNDLPIAKTHIAVRPAQHRATQTTLPALCSEWITPDPPAAILPWFRIKAIAIEAGMPYDLNIETLKPIEGYCVKSIGTTRNHAKASYTKKLGLDVIQDKPIPITGLCVTLFPSQDLEPDRYDLKLILYKTGEKKQAVRSTITVLASPSTITSKLETIP